MAAAVGVAVAVGVTVGVAVAVAVAVAVGTGELVGVLLAGAAVPAGRGVPDAGALIVFRLRRMSPLSSVAVRPPWSERRRGSGERCWRTVGSGANFAARAGVKAGRPPVAAGMLSTASATVPRSPGRIGW